MTSFQLTRLVVKPYIQPSRWIALYGHYWPGGDMESFERLLGLYDTVSDASYNARTMQSAFHFSTGIPPVVEVIDSEESEAANG